MASLTILNIAQLCIKHLPEADQETVFSKKQDFDVDMNLLGWYDTQDESGGQTHLVLVYSE